MVAIGILGATVMPHNLYLHSSIVQTRLIENTDTGKREAIRSSTIDTVVALGFAFFVNAAILVLAAAVFNRTHTIVEDFGEAHRLLSPALGGGAATLFAVALLASGQSSTLTGTLAGQIVMEGFTTYRVKPWIRRMVSRGLAILPAVILVSAFQGHSIDPMIVSQVVLSMQLPFAIIPLVRMTSAKRFMGDFASPMWLTVTAWAFAGLIVGLNAWLLMIQFGAIAMILVIAAIAGYFVWSNRWGQPAVAQ
jgi:manganese transport protein